MSVQGPASARAARRRRHGRAALALLGLVLSFGVTIQAADGVAATAATGATYYLSAGGDDAADGRSPTSAWRSLDRASRQQLLPGDRVLLQGGAIFPGMLYLDATDAGSAASPVTISSYGTGRATIQASGTAGVQIYNTAGVTVSDLDVKGDGVSYRTKGGISFYNDLDGNRKLAGVSIAGVDVSGFRNGVEVGGGRGASGFSQVRVSDVRAHHNMEAGLITYGPAFDANLPTYAHSDVTVVGVQAFSNPGDPTNLTRNTGSGIILGSVAGGGIARSTAYDNGAACLAPEGPVGIWTYDSREVVIEHNVSYRNRTGGQADGGGFDLDQNVAASTLQHNLSYENDGPGYLIYTAQASTAHRDNTVRFNISRDDARKITWHGGITVSGRVTNTQIYDNTVVMAAASTARPPALRLDAGLSGVGVRNNILRTEGGGPIVVSPVALDPQAVTLQGNNYSSSDGVFRLMWGSHYAGLESWRVGSGAETLNGVATGSFTDPQLLDPRVPSSVTSPLVTADGLRLSETSPLRARGLDLRTSFGIDLGPRDHFGTSLSAQATRFDVGAHQPSAVTAATQQPTPAPVAESPPPATDPSAPAIEAAVVGASTVLEAGRLRQQTIMGSSGVSTVRRVVGAGALRVMVTAGPGTTLTATVRSATGQVLQASTGSGSVDMVLDVSASTYEIQVAAAPGVPFGLSLETAAP